MIVSNIKHLWLLLILCNTTSLCAQTAQFIPLGFVPNHQTASKAWGISPDGMTVVGEVKGASGLRAFRWTQDAGMILLQDLTGGIEQGSAKAVTNNPAMIVGWGNSTNQREASLWQNNQVLDLGNLPDDSFAFSADDLSADGSIAIATIRLSSGFFEAVSWTPQQGLVVLGDLTGGVIHSVVNAISEDGSIAVGQSQSAIGNEALYWKMSDHTLHPLGFLPAGNFSIATAVNSDGSVIVGQATSALGNEAFRWTVETGMQPLGDLSGGSFNSKAFDISADGLTIVGKANTSAGDEAFLWQESVGMQNLKQVLTNQYGLSLAGWQLQQATAVSSDGRSIVGIGINSLSQIEAWLVRLPSTTATPGDTNGDNIVNPQDLATLLQNYGTSTFANEAAGDFNQDNKVDLSDLLILKKNFQLSENAAAQTVPEPNAVILTWIGIFMFLFIIQKVNHSPNQ